MRIIALKRDILGKCILNVCGARDIPTFEDGWLVGVWFLCGSSLRSSGEEFMSFLFL